ncbi:MAG: organomercurial lyase [Betaproteobacteria bacterium]|nr:organomercurial lyase [Betaproteobacteria bacterium]
MQRDLVPFFAEAFPAMTSADRRLARTLYGLLARGRPVPPAALAEALARPADEVERTLGRWPGVFREDDGVVVAFWGMTVKEMPHRLHGDAIAASAWCAWDTLWLPALLEATVDVASRCAQSGEPVRLRVSPDRIESVAPAATVLSFLEPDVGKLRANATASFCHFVHFFRDRVAAEQWVVAHPGTFVTSLGEAFDLGRRVNAARYPDLAPQPEGARP